MACSAAARAGVTAPGGAGATDPGDDGVGGRGGAEAGKLTADILGSADARARPVSLPDPPPGAARRWLATLATGPAAAQGAGGAPPSREGAVKIRDVVDKRGSVS